MHKTRPNNQRILLSSLAILLTGIAAAKGRAQAERDDAQPKRLWAAAANGDVPEIRRLLAAGVPVDAKNSYSATALMFACSRAQTDAVEALLEAGADPNVQDTFYSAGPMAWAAMRQATDAAVLLVEAGCKDIDAAFALAIGANDLAATKSILEAAKPDASVLRKAKQQIKTATSAEIKKLFEDVPEEESKTSEPRPQPTGQMLQRFVGEYVAVADADDDANKPEAETDPAAARVIVKVEGDELLLSVGDTTAKLAAVSVNTFEFGGSKYEFSIDEQLVRRLKVTGTDGERQYREVELEQEFQPSSSESLAADLAISSANWMQFRGNGARGVAEGQQPPVTWNVPEDKNVLWTCDIPGLAHSCPIVVGSKLFVTSAISDKDTAGLRTGLYGDVDSVDDESEHRFVLHCLDKDTGEVLWTRVAFTGVPQVKRHLKGTHANPTPASDGQHVVAFFGSEGLYCFTMDGELIWERNFGLLDSGWFFDASYQWGFAASPIIYDGMVILQCDIQEQSFITALDVATGNEIWRREREEIPSWSSPCVLETSEGPQLVTNATKFARSYNPYTGEELWRIGGNSEIAVPTPFIAKDLIFIASGYRPIRPIFAIHPSARGDITLPSGQKSSEAVAWRIANGGPYMPTPICYGDYLYTVNSAGVFDCYEISSGKRVYRKRVSGSGARSFVASLLAADGHIYVPSEEGVMVVVKAGPEFIKVAENPLGQSMLSTPAISDGVMYLRGETSLVAVGRPGDSD